MERQEVSGMVLEALGISDMQLDLVGRILSLEKDKDRIHSVELYQDPDEGYALLADIHLLKDFKGLDEFREYLTSNGLPAETTEQERDGTYRLWVLKICSRFYVPEDSEEE